MKRDEISLVKNHNLHKSLRFIFLIAQIFGFFPIEGVLTADIESISFKWVSIRVASAILTATGGYFVTICHIHHMSNLGYEQFEMDGVVFYTCGATSCVLFIRLATHWHKIMRKWGEIDDMMATYGWPRYLDKKIKIISALFLILEATEHISIQSNKILVAVNCRGSILKGLDHFFVNMSFPHVFNIIPYSLWEGIVLQIVNTRMAFSWTFLDLFIILVSCTLASRFKQINERVQLLVTRKIKNEKTWERVREDYDALCRLCYYIDDKISLLILVSFTNNVYFITIQIFGTINLEETILERVYFFVSLSLLLLRLVAVCYYGSWIHDESQITLYILASTTHEIYNKEIQRFVERVKYDCVGLTGRNLFRITKDLILKIITAVVTYELVLIQFNRSTLNDNKPTKNSIC